MTEPALVRIDERWSHADPDSVCNRYRMSAKDAAIARACGFDPPYSPDETYPPPAEIFPKRPAFLVREEAGARRLVTTKGSMSTMSSADGIAMKRWLGGNSPPDDWDRRGPIKRRNGAEALGIDWKHHKPAHPRHRYDIVAYTPRPPAGLS